MAKKIRLDDLQRMDEVIKAAEGRATVRTITSQGIVKAVNRWVKKVGDMPKAALEDCIITIQASGEKVANSYSGIPMETVAYVKHDTVGWYLSSVDRLPVIPHSWTVSVNLSDKAKSWILDNMRRV